MEAWYIVNFIQRLRLFKRRGEEDVDLYKRLGITKEQWSAWKTRKDAKPKTDTIFQISRTLNLSIEERDWLTYGDRPPPPTIPGVGEGGAISSGNQH